MSPALDAGLTPLEIAAGFPLPDGTWSRPAIATSDRSARAVLEDQILQLLAAGSVAVSFSGGRDSSFMLALATAVARREGLAPPLPVTMRHESPSSQESEWQELMIAHLGLREWVRFDIGDSLDLFGDDGVAMLRSCGLQAPPNTYLHLGMIRAAGTDSLITGAGGDEILGSPGRRLAWVRWGSERWRPSDVGRVVLAGAPLSVRAAVDRRRTSWDWMGPWLRDQPRREIQRLMSRESVLVPADWRRQATLWLRSRLRTRMDIGHEALFHLTGCRVASPLMSAPFVRAFADLVGPTGPSTRERALVMLADDLLPREVILRQTKATFGGVVFGPRFRAFAEAWDPESLAPDLAELVDGVALRTGWITGPTYPSLMLAQRCWLDHDRRG